MNKLLVSLSTVLFLVGLVAGLIVNNKNMITVEPNIHQDIKLNKLNINNLFKYFLFQNLKVITLLILGGFLFGSITFMNLVANGLNISLLIAFAITRGISFKDFILLTLPHGIFEIPAIIIAGAAGFKIPYEIVRYLAGKKEQILTKEDIKEYLTLALISIILIIIAAWVEANVTLKIAKAMLNSTKGI